MEIQMPAEPVICPKCGRTDAVRKVTSILSTGTVTTDTRGFGLTDDERGLKFVDVYTSSTSQSGLAARLSPPVEPRKPSGNPTIFLFMRIGISLIGLVFLAQVNAAARKNNPMSAIPIRINRKMVGFPDGLRGSTGGLNLAASPDCEVDDV